MRTMIWCRDATFWHHLAFAVFAGMLYGFMYGICGQDLPEIPQRFQTISTVLRVLVFALILAAVCRLVSRSWVQRRKSNLKKAICGITLVATAVFAAWIYSIIMPAVLH